VLPVQRDAPRVAPDRSAGEEARWVTTVESKHVVLAIGLLDLY